jgi:hypothetical protein
MTEEEWLACEDPLEVLWEFDAWVIDGVVGDRQLRLFVCACSRRLWHRLTDETKQGVELAERFVDGQASEEDLWNWSGEPSDAEPGSEPADEPALARYCIWQDAAYGSPYYYMREIERVLSEQHVSEQDSAQVGLLRDIFGNPFRPVTFSPAWRTDTAVALASHIYESRDFSAMSILADALQDAGCDNDVILNHCRQPGEHVRGCWVVDLVLGKT